MHKPIKKYHVPFILPFVLILFFFLFGSEEKSPNNNDSSLFPPGKGRDLVISTCTGCHSGKLVTQNQLSYENWDKLITWMQKTQNLWKIDPQERTLILNYLSQNFGEPSHHFSSNTTTGKLGPRVTNPLP